jgi:hypothetical protein
LIHVGLTPDTSWRCGVVTMAGRPSGHGDDDGA